MKVQIPQSESKPVEKIITLTWLTDGSVESAIKNKELAETRIQSILNDFTEHSKCYPIDVHVNKENYSIYIVAEVR